MNGTDLPGIPSNPIFKEIDGLMDELKAEDRELIAKMNLPAEPEVIRPSQSTETILPVAKFQTVSMSRIVAEVTHPVVKKRLGQDGKQEPYVVNEIDTQKLTLHLADAFRTRAVANTTENEPTIWLWDMNRNVYTKNTGAIHQYITEICRFNNNQKQNGIESEVMAMLKGTNFCEESPFNRGYGIPCKNGIIYLHEDTGEITGPHPHTPDGLFTYCLEANYDPSADKEPVMKVLRQWVEEDDIPILLQSVALGFVQSQKDTTYKKSLILHGEGNGGKSSFLELVYRTLGKYSGALGGTSLHSIVNDQFALVELENKIVNVFDELDGPELNGWETFKRLTGATLHTIHEKHKPDHRGRIFCSHIFACNYPPPVPERAKYDGAFWNRWTLVKFPFEYDVDPDWQDKTFTPAFLSGFLNLVLDAMMEISKNGKLTVNMTSDEVMERWYLSSDPLAMWVNDVFTSVDIYDKPVTKLYHYSKNKMFAAYKKDCAENKIDERKIIQTITDFTRKIQKFGFLPGRTVVVDPTGDKKAKKAQVSCYSAYKIMIEPDVKTSLIVSKDDIEQKKIDGE